MHQITWFWPPKLKNLPTVGGGTPPSPRSVASLPRAWSLRSLAFPPTSWNPSPTLLKTCQRPCPEGPVLPWPDRCPNKTTNSGQIRPEDPREHKDKLQASCYSNFPERKWSPGMRGDNFSSHAITLFGNGAFIQLSKFAKSGSWHCHLQWQCTRSRVTYLMQERYQWKDDELLFTYMPHANFKINWF